MTGVAELIFRTGLTGMGSRRSSHSSWKFRAIVCAEQARVLEKFPAMTPSFLTFLHPNLACKAAVLQKVKVTSVASWAHISSGTQPCGSQPSLQRSLN